MVESVIADPLDGDDGPIHVLHVDDHPELLELTADRLEAARDRFAVATATSGAEGLDSLASNPVDCVVSDYDMPGMDGLEFLAAVRERAPDVPFILFTGEGSETIASEAISAGVTDYLQKGTGTEQYAVLANRIENAVERYRSRRAFDETRRWYRTLIERSTDVVTILEADRTIRYQTPTVEHVLGYDTSASVGDDAIEYVHPDDRERVGAAFEAVVSDPDRETESLEFRLLHADGEWRWFDSVITDRTDTPVAGYVINSRDVTERTERERERKRQNDLFARAQDMASVGAWEYDLERDASVVTAEACRLLGRAPDADPTPEETLAAYHPDDRERVADAYERAVREGESYDLEARVVVDGERRWVRTSAEPQCEDGDPVRLRGTLQDVTARRERQRAMRRERDRFSALFEHFPEPTVAYEYVDDEPIVRDVNLAFGETFGLAADRAVGESINDLIVPDERAGEAGRLDELVRAGEPVDTELRRQAADGLRDFWLRSIRVRDDEAFDGFAVYVDVTERRERQRELERKNERLEQFASVVSHDIRNPLNVALGRVELARAEVDDENLALAAGALERMERLVADLLALARQGRGVEATEPVALGDLVDGCWGNVTTADATLRNRLDLTVAADRTRLEQAFENLFRNAIQHGGPDVTITVAPLDDGDGFHVSDDGPGIPVDAREQVFEPGYSSRSEGTGFGLNIVAEVLEAHGWTVRVTESARGGARFEVRGLAATETGRDDGSKER